MHICQYHAGTLEYLRANQQIDLAMTRVLWGRYEMSQYRLEEPDYGEIEVEFTGSASYYLEGRQYVRDQAAKAKQQT